MKISPTAIKCYRRCPRRWGFQKICGLEEPASTSTDDGTACHQIAEGYLKTGKLSGNPSYVAIMQEEIPYLPAPGTCVVEHHVEYELDDVTWHGYVDATHPASRSRIDHKYVRTFDYNLTPTALAADAQGVIYALAPAPDGEIWDTTVLRWNYVSKTKRACQPTVAVLRREDALATLRSVWLPLAREMIAWHNLFSGVNRWVAVAWVDALIPCEPGDCWSFGRHCPFGAICSHRGYR